MSPLAVDLIILGCGTTFFLICVFVTGKIINFAKMRNIKEPKWMKNEESNKKLTIFVYSIVIAVMIGAGIKGLLG